MFITLNSVIIVRAQDPEFTQFYANPLYLNPAFAGTAKGIRFAMNYRNQWPSLPSSFVTYAASYDQHFDDISGGIGIQLLYDRAGDGDLSTTVGNFMYSYFLPVTEKFAIKAGLELSMIQKSIDFSKLSFYDQIDPKWGFIKRTGEDLPTYGVYRITPFMDFSAGIIGFTNKFYAGFCVNHISEPQMSFFDNTDSKLPRKYTAHVGLMLPLDNARTPKNFFSPNILFQKQENFAQLNFGAYYIRDWFVAGAWYRQSSQNGDAAMMLIGVKKAPLKFSYSYDVTISNVYTGGKGSHEVSVIIEIPTYRKPAPVKWRKLICPTF